MVSIPWAITPGSPTDGGDVVAVVDGVEVAGCAGVAHERVPGELDVALGDDVADGESVELRASLVPPHDEGRDRGDDVLALRIRDDGFGGHHRVARPATSRSRP